MKLNKEISRQDIVWSLSAVAVMFFFLIFVYGFDIKYISSIREYKYGAVISMLVIGEAMVLLRNFFGKK